MLTWLQLPRAYGAIKDLVSPTSSVGSLHDELEHHVGLSASEAARLRDALQARDRSQAAEGYVFHSYGDVKYVRHAAVSALTIRRFDADRPIAIYCPRNHRELLEQSGLRHLFDLIEDLPEENRSITGFKLHLDGFLPFDRNLLLDADMIWCRDPDALWQQLSAYSFTATGLDRADFFFGGPKGLGVIFDVIADRRRRTMRRFGLTWLPRVQAGMVYSRDSELAGEVCGRARDYLDRRRETHFRSRLDEGRTEESCEWSIAMAMSSLDLPVHPWFQSYNSPQLDYISGMVEHDVEFRNVRCRYYCDRRVYSLRGIPNTRLRSALIAVASRVPGRCDYHDVTPFALHFGWYHEKPPFWEFADRTWHRLVHVAGTAAKATESA